MYLVKPSFEILSEVDPQRMLQDIERAGRTCYKSEDMITPTSAEDFCRMVIRRGHESVIEHVSLSVLFIIDRGVSHELVRHRLCAFSQESTRYCDYSGEVTFVIPPWVLIPPGKYVGDEEFDNDPASSRWLSSLAEAEEAYQRLREEGWSPQMARSVLPNSLKTEIVATANLREWRYIFKLRCPKAAHPQMREVMIPLQQEFRDELPPIFEY